MSLDLTRTHTNQKLRCLLHCGLHQRTIEVTCPRCSRIAKLDAVPLWWWFEKRGWSDALPEAMRRLYCKTCRAAGQIVRPRWRITEDAPDSAQFPYPDAGEWKRQISRYRS
jgi:hypothetical protein